MSEGSIEVFTAAHATWQPLEMVLGQESASMSEAGATESAMGERCVLASERKRRWSEEVVVSSGAQGKRIRQYEKKRISRLELEEHAGMEDALSNSSVQEQGRISMLEEDVQGGMEAPLLPALDAPLSIHFSAEEAHLPEYMVLEEDGLDGGEDEGMQQQQRRRRRRRKSSPWRVLRHPDSTKDARELTLLPDREVEDLLLFNAAVRAPLIHELQKELRSKGAFKVKVTAHLCISKAVGEEEDFAAVTSGACSALKDTTLPVVSPSDVEPQVHAMLQELANRFEVLLEKGSGWVLKHVQKLSCRCISFVPFRAGSFLPTPPELAAKKCIINVRNEDDRCFEYAVLSALCEVPINRERPSAYKEHRGRLDFSGIPFPVQEASIPRFEQQNRLNIHVLKKQVGPRARAGPPEVEHHSALAFSSAPIVLLRLYDAERSHYVLVRSLNALMRTGAQHAICCRRCLARFKTATALSAHLKHSECSKKAGVQQQLPSASKDSACRFKSIRKQLPCPFVIYADSEAMLEPCQAQQPSAKTAAYQEHTCTHIGAQLVSRYPELWQSEYVQFQGPKCAEDFLLWTQEMSAKAKAIVSRKVPMHALTEEQEQEFRRATQCWICKKALLPGLGHRDHDHLSGEYRGPAHASCNLQYSFKGHRLPIFFHNLRGYDGHFLLRAAGKVSATLKMTCLAKTAEAYMSFTIGSCEFKDSALFLSAPLSQLVEDVRKAGAQTFQQLHKAFSAHSEHARALLLRKGVFPYDWYSAPEKLLQTQLPPQEAFFSELSKSSISAEDYAHAQCGGPLAAAACRTTSSCTSALMCCCWQMSLRPSGAWRRPPMGWTPATSTLCLASPGMPCSR